MSFYFRSEGSITNTTIRPSPEEWKQGGEFRYEAKGDVTNATIVVHRTAPAVAEKPPASFTVILKGNVTGCAIGHGATTSKK